MPLQGALKARRAEGVVHHHEDGGVVCVHALRHAPYVCRGTLSTATRSLSRRLGQPVTLRDLAFDLERSVLHSNTVRVGGALDPVAC